MKHLLNGVAIAAALAIAAPAWAQAPAKPAPAAAAKAAPAAAAPMAPKQAHKRPARQAAKPGKMHKMSAGDQATEQLNREELARIQGAAPAEPPAAAPTSPSKTPR